VAAIAHLRERLLDDPRRRLEVGPTGHGVDVVRHLSTAGHGADPVCAANQAGGVEEAVGPGHVALRPGSGLGGRALPLLLGLGDAGGVRGLRVAAHGLGHDARAVDGHADRLADVLVVERLLLGVQVQERGVAEVGIPVRVAGGILGDVGLLDVGHEEGRPVQLALLQRLQDLLVGVVHGHPQPGDQRLARLPIVRVAAQLVRERLEPHDLGEGAGAHRARVVEGGGLATPFHLCSDTIGSCPIETSPGVKARLNANSTVAGSTALTSDRKSQILTRSSAGKRRSRSKVNTTSRAVKGAPSDQVTPGRRAKRRRWLLLLQS
jgi:hypothetical protein